MKLFATQASAASGERLAAALGRALSASEEREFAWGEHKMRSLEDVAGEDVYVLASLHGDRDMSVNDKLCRLAFFLGSLRDDGARRVTAIVPYLAYSRKDRRTKNHDPVSTRYVAAILQSVGIDAVVTVDVHNPAAFENAFRCQSINLSTHALFVEHFARRSGVPIDTIVSPDLGGAKAAKEFHEAYSARVGRDLGLAVIEKRRSEGRVTGGRLLGDVGEHVLIVDDMIGSGTTVCRAARACADAGARRLTVAATHGLFEPGYESLFADEAIGDIAVCDTVETDRLGLADDERDRLATIETGPMIADCICRMDAARGRQP